MKLVAFKDIPIGAKAYFHYGKRKFLYVKFGEKSARQEESGSIDIFYTNFLRWELYEEPIKKIEKQLDED